jgi:uncharacterized membrane protein
MTIKINKVPTQNALAWISHGWVLFKAQAGLWILSIFCIFGAAIIASMAGIIGSVLFAFAQPFLVAGIYHMAFHSNNGLTSEIKDLFIAFKNVRVRRVFIQIASLELLVAIVLSPFSSEIQTAILNTEPLSTQTALLYTIFNLISFMFLLYAVPIAWFFHEQNLLSILKLSFIACFNNIGVLLVFAVLSFGLFLLTLPTFLIGLVVVLPWLTISAYLSFNDMFESDMPIEHDSDDDITLVV